MSVTSTTLPKPGFTESFKALRNRNYRFYWWSGFGMSGAQGIQQLAMAWLVLELTDSAGQLGLVFFIQGISTGAMALFGGVLVDRYNRKNLLILSQVFTFANLLILAALSLTELVAVWQLYISSIGLGVMMAITMPARNALIPSIVSREDSMNAVALNAMQMHSSRVIWPTIAGVMIATMGVGASLVLSAVCSLFGIVWLLRVKIDDTAAPVMSRSNPLREVAEGLRYTFAHPVIGRIMTLALSLSAFGLAFMSLGPGFARQELHFSASTTGFFLMAAGSGSLVGAVLMVAIKVQATTKLFVISCAGFALSLLLLCANPYAPASFLCMIGFGFSTSVLSIAAQTILQTEAEPHLFGRVFSLWSLGGGLAAITALPIGIVGDLVSMRVSLGIVSVMLLLMCLVVGMGVQPLRWLGSRSLPPSPEPLEAEPAGD